MRVMLCHPNQKVCLDGMKGRPMVGPPLGLMLVAAHLRGSGLPCEIEIYDARISSKLSIDENGDQIFGDTDAESVERVRRARPHVVGISNMFTVQIGRAYALANRVRVALPEAVIVIGGPHVTVFPQEALELSSIDYVVLGEGEQRMTELVRALIEGRTPVVEGVVGRSQVIGLPQNKKPPISYIDDIDRLPFPAYDLVDLQAYFNLARRGFSPRYREWGQRALTVLTSRGCPHTCTFCSIHATMGYRYRFHSVDYMKRHIALLVSRYGIDFIHFEDDNLTHKPERYDEIIQYLTTFKPRIGWDTPNGVRGDTWTRERIRDAKLSGCQFLTVAIESAVQRVLDEIVRKKLDLERVEQMILWCQEFKLRLHAFYIIGFPGETLIEMQTTIDFALDRYRRFGVTPFLQTLIPLPGTPIQRLILKFRFYKDELEPRHNQVTTGDFTPEQVRRLYRRYLWHRIGIFVLRTLTSRQDFGYNAKLVLRYPRAVAHAARNAISASW